MSHSFWRLVSSRACGRHPDFELKPKRLLRALVVVLTLLANCAFADDFQSANELYDQGKFAEARQSYEKLVLNGERSANLFYNLANTYFRLSDSGRAILNYERALVLDPMHKDARANLKLVRERAGAKLPPRTWLDAVFPEFGLDAWTMIAMTSAWIAVFGLAAVIVFRVRNRPGLWLTIVLALLVAAWAGVGTWRASRDRSLAIVVEKEAKARRGKVDTAAVAELLPAGSQVRVLAETGGWFDCELPGGGDGWLPITAVERVRL